MVVFSLGSVLVAAGIVFARCPDHRAGLDVLPVQGKNDQKCPFPDTILYIGGMVSLGTTSHGWDVRGVPGKCFSFSTDRFSGLSLALI